MKLNPDIVFREEFDGQGIIFNPSNGDTYGVNTTATLIWKELEAGTPKKDILKKIAEKIELPDCAAADLEAFLAQLIEKGYLSE